MLFEEGASARISSARGGAPVLQQSSFEELNVVSIDPGDVEDLPSHTQANDKLMEVVTHAVAKLNID